MADISELKFEEEIELSLLAGGPDGGGASEGVVTEPIPEYGSYVPGHYRKRSWKDYDRELCLDAHMVVAFVQATQPKKWTRLTERYGNETVERFARRGASEAKRRGVLEGPSNGVNE